MNNKTVLQENFSKISNLYDQVMADNVIIHDLVYPQVFGKTQYIGQFSDNSADELSLMGQLLQLSERSRVLDIGCGRGNVAAFMSQKFNWEITGIDLSKVVIDNAVATHREQNNTSLHFVHGNLYQHPFKNTFDGVYGTGAFCHFDAEKLFQRCYQLLNSCGRIAFIERVQLAPIDDEHWEHLTTHWSCPYVYTIDNYHDLLNKFNFKILHTLNLTDNFRIWQEQSVKIREALKEEIIQLSSAQYYQDSLNFARYEYEVTNKSQLGCACIVAAKESS